MPAAIPSEHFRMSSGVHILTLLAQHSLLPLSTLQDASYDDLFRSILHQDVPYVDLHTQEHASYPCINIPRCCQIQFQHLALSHSATEFSALGIVVPTSCSHHGPLYPSKVSLLCATHSIAGQSQGYAPFLPTRIRPRSACPSRSRYSFIWARSQHFAVG